MAILPVGIGSEEASYRIERSLRFNSADSAYLNRTPASAGNRKTWTISVWIKRTNPGTENWVYDGGSTSNSSGFQFTDTNLLRVLSTSSSGAVDDLDIRTTQVFRDPSAWYHIVLAVDTTQATSTNRVKLYVNGSQVTAFGTANYPTQNYDFGVNNNHSQKIGKWNISTGRDFSGYMADFYLVDGSALDPTSFGEYNSDTGVWQPKAYTGSYGTNGFYLDFADNSSTTALGYDAAGSNDWTPNNFSVTAGAGNDSLVDTPTPYGTNTGAGGEVRGNYCTFNAIAKTSNVTLTNGNLDAAFGTVSGGGGVIATIAPSSGKWYWEVTVTAVSSASIHIGVIKDVLTTFSGTQYYEPGLTADGYAYQNDGTKYNNNSNTSYGASYTTNDVIGVAMDLDAGTLTFYKNGTTQGQAFSGLSGGYFPAVGDGSSAGTHSVTANFGQRPFAYAAPTGFKALCTQNLPDPTIADGSTAMNVVTYTGNATNRSIDVGMAPDFTWIKHRSSAENHNLYDILRGAGYRLESNSTDSQTYYADRLTAFTSTGFNLGTGYNNTNGTTYVAWNWKAGGTGVTNTAGTITSTVSANTTAGFSIVTYTGNGTNGATIGHGLGVTPSMIIVKSRGTTDSWGVYHTSIGNTKGLYLETTGAAVTSSAFWNNTSPTSTVFSVSNNSINNASSTNYVAYCFAPVEGYSAFGSYTGNGSSDGPFVFCNFRPRFILFKKTNDAGDWNIRDTSRSPYNVVGEALYPNLSYAEYSGTETYVDILSNGFKLRGNWNSTNASGGTYIYAAFAEVPMKFALGR